MRSVAVVSLALLLVGGARAEAQEGPSFNCDYAGTRTEQAICASPRLARIERWVVESFEDLAGRIGRREARAIADEQLVVRQACEGEPACIEARLVATLGVFAAYGAATPVGVALEPGLLSGTQGTLLATAPPGTAAPEQLPIGMLPPEERLALGPPREVATFEGPRPEARPEPGPEVPLAAAFAEEPNEELPGEELPGEEALDDDLPLAALAPDPLDVAPPEVSTGEAGFTSALAAAFEDLPTYRRANVQGRLSEAGYSSAPPDAAWSPATAAALLAFAREAARQGSGFDVLTPEGAAALLDYVDSDEFKDTVLGGGLRAGSGEGTGEGQAAALRW